MVRGILSLPLRWNRRIAVPAGRFFTLVFLLVFSFYILWTIRRTGTLNYPPDYIGDHTYFDLIGINIFKFHGFGRNIVDPDYLSAYKGVGLDTALRAAYFSTGYTEPSTTTTRPPALPILIAMTHWAFGRQFWAIRTLNAVFMAAAVSLGGVFCLRAIGWVPALLCIGLLWCPWGILKSGLEGYSTDIFTENLACLCVMAMACWMQSLASRSSPGSWVGVGIVAGLAVLTRTSFALWLPGLVILTYLLVRSRLASGIFFASALVVVLPWMVRNCIVLHAFMPLGAQGSIDLPAAFSDAAVEHGGLWFPHIAFPIPAGPYRALLTPGRTPEVGVLDVDSERRMAQHAQAEAWEWIKGQPRQVVMLALSKARKEWRIDGVRDGIRLMLFLLGTLLFWDLPTGKIILGFAAINTQVIGATWSVGGRFMLPVQPLVVAAICIGGWAIYVTFVEFRGPLIFALFNHPSRMGNENAFRSR